MSTVDLLFQFSMKLTMRVRGEGGIVSIITVIKGVLEDVPTFDSLCCNVQQAIVDIEFIGRLTTYTTLLFFIGQQQWDAVSKDLMYNTALCGQVPKKIMREMIVITGHKCLILQIGTRCTDDASLFEQGCPCFGSTPSACSGSGCCQSGIL